MKLQKELVEPFNRKVVLVKSREELLDAHKKGDIAIVLTIEGAHTLFGEVNARWNKHFDCDGENEECLKDLFTNISELRTQEFTPFFLTLSHLTWNRISGHAKSLDLASVRWLLAGQATSESFRRKIFNKHANGLVDTVYRFSRITDELCKCKYDSVITSNGIGKKIVNAVVSNSDDGQAIYIDMRHMDIQSRVEYISIVKEYNKQGRNIPLIISHTAASGKNLAQSKILGSCPIVDQYKELTNPNKYYKKFGRCLGNDQINTEKTNWFFPWSINLADEEIAEVHTQGGIIGITLEERVLGFNMYNYNKTHYKRLYDSFRIKNLINNKHQFDTLRKLEPLMRNILYIVENSGYAGKLKSWQHIALGSDFDGVVNPIDVCTRASDIPSLYQGLAKYLPAYSQFLNKEYLMLDHLNSPEVLLNLFFYKNGEDFILKYYDSGL
jgi:hypothetical protein